MVCEKYNNKKKMMTLEHIKLSEIWPNKWDPTEYSLFCEITWDIFQKYALKYT